MSTKVALVTGAAGDLGSTISLRLAKDGFDLALNDLPSRKGDLQNLEADIKKLGRRVFIAIADITVESEVEAIVDATVDELGSFDVMVANVGKLIVKPLVQITVSEWDDIFSTNVRGMFICYKAAAKKMIQLHPPPSDPAEKVEFLKNGIGRIIGGCSVAGLTGAPMCGAYNSSKFAVRGLTQCAAIEFGSFGISVNAYAPGFIEGTKMVSDLANGQIDLLPPPFRDANSNNLENWTKFVQATGMIKLGRLGQKDEVAAVVSFLASPEGRYIHGQTWAVDGGMHLA